MLGRCSKVYPPLNECTRQAPRVGSLRRFTSQLRQARRLSGITPTSKRDPPDFAFAFDIDGVLLRSAAPIPGASQSLRFLQTHHIPFILLTNGGGKHESERVSEISRALSLPTPLTTKNFIQSHTPMADFLRSFPHPNNDHPSNGGLAADSTILVVGGEANACRLVAESYGYTNVLTPGDILASYPEIWPFSRVYSDYYSSFARPLPLPINPTTSTPSIPSTTSPNKSSGLKIDAILIFNDPRDWALDIQLILDILLSHHGILGTISPLNGDPTLPNAGYQQDGQPALYFSNPDLLWAGGWHLPRLGQGGFQAALEGVWRAVTGGMGELKAGVIGKPSALTYEFAEKMLRRYRQDLLRQTAGGREEGEREKELRKVYMVGDNPESDIMGANNYNEHRKFASQPDKKDTETEWISILVKTGVFSPEHVGKGRRYDFDKRPELKPRVVVQDVQEAVEWGLRDAGWSGEGVGVY